MLVTRVNIRPHALNMYMPMVYYNYYYFKFYLKSVHSSDRQVFFAKVTTYNTRGTNGEKRKSISPSLSDPLGPNPSCVLDKISLHQVNFEGLLLSKSDNNACPSPTRDSLHQTHRLELQHF